MICNTEYNKYNFILFIINMFTVLIGYCIYKVKLYYWAFACFIHLNNLLLLSKHTYVLS